MRRKRPGQRVEEAGGEADVQGIGMRLSTAGATNLSETIDTIAEALADQHTPADQDDAPTVDQLRAQAAELLADPHAAARLHSDVLSGAVPDVARVEGTGHYCSNRSPPCSVIVTSPSNPMVDLNLGRWWSPSRPPGRGWRSSQRRR